MEEKRSKKSYTENNPRFKKLNVVSEKFAKKIYHDVKIGVVSKETTFKGLTPNESQAIKEFVGEILEDTPCVLEKVFTNKNSNLPKLLKLIDTGTEKNLRTPTNNPATESKFGVGVEFNKGFTELNRIIDQEQRKLDEQNAEVIRIEDEYAKLHAEIERQMEIRKELQKFS